MEQEVNTTLVVVATSVQKQTLLLIENIYFLKKSNMNYYKKWTCRQCSHVETEYQTMCGECGKDRGFFRWYFSLGNWWTHISQIAWLICFATWAHLILFVL